MAKLRESVSTSCLRKSKDSEARDFLVVGLEKGEEILRTSRFSCGCDWPKREDPSEELRFDKYEAMGNVHEREII
jgi:hypothetical protein